MNVIALFWTGVGLVIVAIVGLALGLIRAGGNADDLTDRALRQERAVRAGVAPHTGLFIRRPADAPSRAPTPPGHAGATTSRKDHHGR